MSLQHFSTALLLYYCVYKVLQSNTPTVRPPKRRQKTTFINVLLRTTKYYCVLQNDHPVLLGITKYYKILLRPQNEVHSVLLGATKYHYALRNDHPVLLRTTYYKTTFQYYSVLPSTTETTKTSTFQATSFQNKHFVRGIFNAAFQVRSVENEHFVRGFLNFSSKKLSK